MSPLIDSLTEFVLATKSGSIEPLQNPLKNFAIAIRDMWNILKVIIEKILRKFNNNYVKTFIKIYKIHIK